MKYTLTMLLSLALFSACNDMAKQVDDQKENINRSSKE